MSHNLSPLSPARQNDYREQSVSAAAEHETWRDTMGETREPEPVQAIAEVTPDEWLAKTLTLALADGPVQIAGDDPTRRSILIKVQSILSSISIAPTRECYSNGLLSSGPAGFLVESGDAITLTTTRAVWAWTGGVASVSIAVERGRRER